MCFPPPANLARWKISDNDKCRCKKMGTMHHILSNYPLKLSVMMPGDTIEFYRYYIRSFVERLTLKPRKKAPDSCHGKISPFPKKGPNRNRNQRRPLTILIGRDSWSYQLILAVISSLLSQPKRNRTQWFWCEGRKIVKLVELPFLWDTNFDETRIRNKAV